MKTAHVFRVQRAGPRGGRAWRWEAYDVEEGRLVATGRTKAALLHRLNRYGAYVRYRENRPATVAMRLADLRLQSMYGGVIARV